MSSLFDSSNGESFLLTPAKVEEWRHARATLEGEIQERQEKVEALNRRINAAFVLMPSLRQDAGEKQGAEAPTLMDRIRTVLTEHAGERLTPKQIRQSLVAKGWMENNSDNYLYTAVKRASDKRMILKDGATYYVAAEGGG